MAASITSACLGHDNSQCGGDNRQHMWQKLEIHATSNCGGSGTNAHFLMKKMGVFFLVITWTLESDANPVTVTYRNS